MTICIATAFQWHPKADSASERAILIASDRMLTAGDVQYEPAQSKVAVLTTHSLALIAGEITVHSEAIDRTQRELAAEFEDDIYKIAEKYAGHIRDIRREQAEALYLAPLGLTIDTFTKLQADMNQQNVSELVYQMQHHTVDAEALIVGSDNRQGHIFHVDAEGIVTRRTDESFAAIGYGSWHANSYLMQQSYAHHSSWLGSAVWHTFVAKKRAEVAPGIGRHTDMGLVTKDGLTPISENIFNSLYSHAE